MKLSKKVLLSLIATAVCSFAVISFPNRVSAVPPGLFDDALPFLDPMNALVNNAIDCRVNFLWGCDSNGNPLSQPANANVAVCGCGYNMETCTAGCTGDAVDSTSWVCDGAADGDATLCYATDGACGNINGGTYASAPQEEYVWDDYLWGEWGGWAQTTYYCNSGAPSALFGQGPWFWMCFGSDAGTTATCTANATNPYVEGSCGSSNGQTLASAPIDNFCNTGTFSGLSGSGPWSWSCNGANGGPTANCSANREVTDNGCAANTCVGLTCNNGINPNTPGTKTTGECAAPTGFAYTCTNNGQTLNLSWDPNPSASSYHLRIDDKSNSWYTATTDTLANNHAGTSFSRTVTPGTMYHAWIHSVGASGFSSASDLDNIVCYAPPTATLMLDDVPSGTKTIDLDTTPLSSSPTVKLSWTSSGAMSCTARSSNNALWGGTTPHTVDISSAGDIVTLTPTAFSSYFFLKCSNPGGDSPEQKVNVTTGCSRKSCVSSACSPVFEVTDTATNLTCTSNPKCSTDSDCQSRVPSDWREVAP